jgi:hypothetical protein
LWCIIAKVPASEKAGYSDGSFSSRFPGRLIEIEKAGSD